MSGAEAAETTPAAHFEWRSFRAATQEKFSEEDFEALKQRFSEADADGSGALDRDEVRVVINADNGSHSKRPAALRSQRHELSFGHVVRLGPLPTISKGLIPTRRIDAHSALCLTRVSLRLTGARGNGEVRRGDQQEAARPVDEGQQ